MLPGLRSSAMSSRGAREGPEAGAETDVDAGFALREGTGRAADLVGVFRAAHPPASATTAANTSVKRIRTRGDFALTDPGQFSMSLGYPKSPHRRPGVELARGASEWCRRWESNPHAREERGILSPLRLPFRHSGPAAMIAGEPAAGCREKAVPRRDPPKH